MQPDASQHMWDNIFHTEIQKLLFKAMHECNFTCSQIQACGWAAQGQRVWSKNGTDHPPIYHLDIIKKKIIKKKNQPCSDQHYIANITFLQ